MMIKTPRTERRNEALSKERIVEAAIEILDADGEGALTFRALAARLSTGAGAIYWHVADKNDLMAAAADGVIGRALVKGTGDMPPCDEIRAVALSVFDAIEAHPWVGAQLSREPWGDAMLRIFERIGGQLQALGAPERAWFDSASALLNFILGVAGQNAAAARLDGGMTDRSAFLASVADRWMQRAPADYPFVHQMAAQLREHDDRQQFLAGVDFILTGVEALR